MGVGDVTAKSDSLAELRALAKNTPRCVGGVLDLDGYTIHYTDAASLYVEYKDIFQQAIYRFESQKRSPCIVDGGACIGMATLYWRQLYPEAEIIAFEPDPSICRVFEENMRANDIRGVRLVEAGLGATEGDRFFKPDGADGGRIADGPGTQAVHTVLLSEYLQEPIDFLKLNIEGQELPVLLEIERAGCLADVREMVIEYHGWVDIPQYLGNILTLLDRNGFRYAVHDFDREDSPASKPPFRSDRPRDWYCLIHAFQPKSEPDLPQRTSGEAIIWGDLHREAPISRKFGFDRGRPIDRYYIERFLDDCKPDVRGRVLEFGDDSYTRRLGGEEVTQSDVWHAKPGNARATIVANLTDAPEVHDDTFDCIICTQTLHVLFEMERAIATLHRILAPGGVLLATIPGISQISRYDMDRWGDYWRLTSLAAKRLFEPLFGEANVKIESYGNVAAAVGFLHGLATEEMSRQRLDRKDPDYEVVVTIRATKAAAED